MPSSKNKKLTSHEEIKKYVVATIKTGNKKRIKEVMARYVEWLKEKELVQEDLIEQAKEIFDVKE